MAETAEARQQEELEEKRAETLRQAQGGEHSRTITEKKRIERARSWGKAWIEERDLEMIAFSRAIGFGDGGRTTVSRFLGDKLDGDPTRVVLAIEQYRATQEGPEGISAVIGFRETKTARLVWAHANGARDGHKMAAVIGFTGYGKTEALKQYQRTTHGDLKPPVRILTCNVLTNAPFLARKLALDMGLVEKGGEPAMCLELVMKRLRSHPEFWIVDEANFLQERCLHVLRNIYDVTATGMLLAGTPTFLSMVGNRSNGAAPYHAAGSEGEGRRPMDGPLALFADRVFTQALPGVTDEEAVEIAEDVLKADLTEQGISKLLFYVNHNMRLLTRLLLELREYRKRSNARKIDEKMVEAGWAKLQHIDR